MRWQQQAFCVWAQICRQEMGAEAEEVAVTEAGEVAAMEAEAVTEVGEVAAAWAAVDLGAVATWVAAGITVDSEVAAARVVAEDSAARAVATSWVAAGPAVRAWAVDLVVVEITSARRSVILAHPSSTLADSQVACGRVAGSTFKISGAPRTGARSSMVGMGVVDRVALASGVVAACRGSSTSTRHSRPSRTGIPAVTSPHALRELATALPAPVMD